MAKNVFRWNSEQSNFYDRCNRLAVEMRQDRQARETRAKYQRIKQQKLIEAANREKREAA